MMLRKGGILLWKYLYVFFIKCSHGIQNGIKDLQTANADDLLINTIRCTYLDEVPILLISSFCYRYKILDQVLI